MRTVNTLVAALVASLSLSTATAHAGDKRGPLTMDSIIDSMMNITLNMTLRAHQLTTITIEGDSEGAGDIDCTLYDKDETVIAYDLSDRNGCALTVNPGYQGKFTLVYSNRGDDATQYHLTVK